MKKPESSWLLPTGVFEMPPARAAFIRMVEGQLMETFRLWGYSEVRTPAMEYLETMAQGLETAELDMAFKLVDRATGRVMVLRSDMTPQVARMAALALRDVPHPLRLCYVSDVYRYSGDPSRPRRELIQAGAELLGTDDPRADAEVIALAVESLKRIGISAIRISLGQVSYARGLLKECGLSRETEDLLIGAADRKDVGEVGRILDRAKVQPPLRRCVLSLAKLHGGIETVREAMKGAPNRECSDALSNLMDVLDLAVSHGVDASLIDVDLGELSSFRYHTGIVFSGFVSGAGRAVLKGGRYDDLAGKFGRSSPATGFAIDILELLEIVSRNDVTLGGVDYLLVNRSGDRTRGPTAAMELRRKGRGVFCLIRDLGDDELPAFAGAHGIATIIVLEDGGVRRWDVKAGKSAPCEIDSL
ncbi:MAG TPA: ATP phosphoribosyltransferase regulatory subunit [Proteobacteria bacterium]|nr:ATP phosphoribosyltransferase regulatory subunit [bacterium BMS3Abin14]HDL53975.1 ATP phosphoribosyltransferase regulatory subunit [Pseudomonadota bacterium]